MSSCTRERDSSGQWAATKRSSRVPALVPLYEAEIVAEVDMRTNDVLTVKLTLLAPAGTITLEGTLAAPLLLERKT